jgi:hypothetical protein
MLVHVAVVLELAIARLALVARIVWIPVFFIFKRSMWISTNAKSR